MRKGERHTLSSPAGVEEGGAKHLAEKWQKPRAFLRSQRLDAVFCVCVGICAWSVSRARSVSVAATAAAAAAVVVIVVVVKCTLPRLPPCCDMRR